MFSGLKSSGQATKSVVTGTVTATDADVAERAWAAIEQAERRSK